METCAFFEGLSDWQISNDLFKQQLFTSDSNCWLNTKYHEICWQWEDGQSTQGHPTTFVERQVYKSTCWSLNQRAKSFGHSSEFPSCCFGKWTSSLHLLWIYYVLLFWVWLWFFQSSSLATNLDEKKIFMSVVARESKLFIFFLYHLFRVSLCFFFATCWLELLSSHITGPSWCTVFFVNIVDSS